MNTIFLRNDRPSLIAEIGINHNGSLETAVSMIESAAKAGADFVKFQTFDPSKMYTRYTKSILETGKEGSADTSIIDFFGRLRLDESAHAVLKQCAEKNGVHFLSAPFDCDSFDLLERVGVSAYKIASSEVTHVPLLEKIAKTSKPVVMSTGMTHKEEISHAIEILQRGGCSIVLLHCVALYPVPAEQINLSRIETLRKEFGLPVGFSDHSPDIEYALAAAWMGASVIEKHFTLSRDFECPDGNVSVTPEQITELKNKALSIFTMRGDGKISYGKEEEKLAKSARRSLFASRDLKEGAILSAEDFIAKRPGTGINPQEMSAIIGKKMLKTVPVDFMLRYEDFE
jgi:N,N'-diacetyllegionaminate synthase